MSKIVSTKLEESSLAGDGQCVFIDMRLRLDDVDLTVAATLLAGLKPAIMGVLNQEPEPAAEPEEKPKRKRGRPRKKVIEEAAEAAAAEPDEPEEEEDEEPEPKRPRRRRAKAAEVEEVEEEAPKTRRRRRAKANGAAEPDGPTKEDVAKAASEAARELGPELVGEIILDYSTSAKLDDIPATKRQAFIDEINNELGDE